MIIKWFLFIVSAYYIASTGFIKDNSNTYVFFAFRCLCMLLKKILSNREWKKFLGIEPDFHVRICPKFVFNRPGQRRAMFIWCGFP